MKKLLNIRVIIAVIVISLLFSIQVLALDKNKFKKTDYPLNQFSISISNDWEEIPQNILQEYVAAVSEQFPNFQKASFDYAFQLKSATNWFDYPYILINVNDKGRISSKELKKINQNTFRKIDIKSLEKSSNNFISDINFDETIYDSKAHVIWTKMKGDMQGYGNIIVISAMCLTANGWIQLNYSAAENDNFKHEKVFKEIVDSIEIYNANKYRDDKSVIWYALIGLLGMGFKLLLGMKKKSNYT